MNILLYQWKAYGDRYLKECLLKKGHAVSTWSNPDMTFDKIMTIEKLDKKLRENKYDLVMSYDYFRGVAIACHENNIPYAAWTQDAPLLSLYDDSVGYETNYIFCFDSEQFDLLEKRGAKHAFYLPMGVPIEHIEDVIKHISIKDNEKMGADVSFVGSLYSDRSMLRDFADQLPIYIRGYLDGFMHSQLEVPAIRFSEMKIDSKVMNYLKDNLIFHGEEFDKITYEQLMDNLLDREVTAIERKNMLSTLHRFKGFKLYTNSDHIPIEGMINNGTVDYYTDMYKVFHCSKVNVNVTLRSIRRGIPLRIIDVIAAEGFMLTNTQSDLFYFFEDGKNIVTFENLNDMEEKLRFYLGHEEERMRIVSEGKIVIREYFDLNVQVDKILSVL